MTSERLSTASIDDASIAEIDETPELTGDDVRGRSEIHSSLQSESFLKVIDADLQDAISVRNAFEARVSDKEREAFYDPAQRVRELLGLAEPASETTAATAPMAQTVDNQHEEGSTDEVGTATRSKKTMGRAALWMTKMKRSARKLKHTATTETAELTAKLPGVSSEKMKEKNRIRDAVFAEEDQKLGDKIEELSDESYTPENGSDDYPRSEKSKRDLGKAASWFVRGPKKLRAAFKRAPRSKEVIDEPSDSWWTRTRRRIGTKEVIIGGGMIGAVGAAAITGAIMFNPDHHRVVHQATDLSASTSNMIRIDNGTVTTQFESTAIIVPGHWDGTADGMYNAMESQGALNGTMVMKDQYSAEMANPFMPGDTQTTQESSQEAVQPILNAYYATPSDKLFTVYGFSQGNFGANEAMNQIIANNGGVKPDNIQYVAIASPLAPTGVAHNAFVNVVEPILTGPLQIPLNEAPAPGTLYITDQNDVVGNGANQSAIASLLMTADFSNAHNLALESGNKPCVTVLHGADGSTDCVIGDVHPLTQLLQQNAGITLDQHANQALQDFIPINDGSSTDVPRPNVNAGLNELGESIDQNTHTNIGTTLINNMPVQVKTGLQAVDNAATDIPNTVAAIGNGTENPITGTQDILNSVQSAVNGVVNMLPKPQAGYQPVRQTIQNTVQSYAPNIIPPSVRQSLNVPAASSAAQQRANLSQIFSPKR